MLFTHSVETECQRGRYDARVNPDSRVNPDALRDLIEERKSATGRSYEAIAKRGGGGISRAAVHRLATRPITRLPDATTIEALGKGLDIDPAEVFRAACESLGFVTSKVELPQDTHSVAIVASLGEMTEEDRAAVARMVEGLLATRRAMEGE